MGRSPCRCVLPECRGVTTRPPEPENRPPINLSGSGQWAALERLRGSEFHRVRRQSPFVAGARQSSVWRVEGQTRILEPADDLPTASEVERWLTDLGTKSTAALRRCRASCGTSALRSPLRWRGSPMGRSTSAHPDQVARSAAATLPRVGERPLRRQSLSRAMSILGRGS
jgi:hypothetical protein